MAMEETGYGGFFAAAGGPTSENGTSTLFDKYDINNIYSYTNIIHIYKTVWVCIILWYEYLTTQSNQLCSACAIFRVPNI